MKKTSSRIREEIAKLQDVLKAAETREAERIGRIALKAGLGDVAIEDGVLLAAFEDVAKRFHTATARHNASSAGQEKRGPTYTAVAQISPGTSEGGRGEA
jgi:hypothetical protein